MIESMAMGVAAVAAAYLFYTKLPRIFAWLLFGLHKDTEFEHWLRSKDRSRRS